MPNGPCVWYIPILADGSIPGGSDGAYASHYVRRDKVKEHINAIVKVSKCAELYRITDRQFWDIKIWDPIEVRKYGVKVYDKEKTCQNA